MHFTIGAGNIVDHKQYNEDDLQQMINDRTIGKLQEGTYYSDAAQLGELLMDTMLEEVNEFCKINVQQNWAAHTHKQVIINNSILLRYLTQCVMSQ